ncbi:EamA-like transporter family protein, partial [Haemophilus influenzae]
AARCICRAFLL